MYVLLIPYLDLHGSFGSLGGPAGGGAPPPDGTIRDADGDGGAEYDRVFLDGRQGSVVEHTVVEWSSYCRPSWT